jgi:hypothetical protein
VAPPQVLAAQLGHEVRDQPSEAIGQDVRGDPLLRALLEDAEVPPVDEDNVAQDQ